MPEVVRQLDSSLLTMAPLDAEVPASQSGSELPAEVLVETSVELEEERI